MDSGVALTTYAGGLVRASWPEAPMSSRDLQSLQRAFASTSSSHQGEIVRESLQIELY